MPHAMTIREFAVSLDFKLIALNWLSTIAGRRGPVNLLRTASATDPENRATRGFSYVNGEDGRLSKASALVGRLHVASVLFNSRSDGHSVEVHSRARDHLGVS